MEGGFTEAYCAWFDALPPEVARELAMMLAKFAPGGMLESSLFTADPLDGFAARMRRLAGRDPSRDAGTALMLRSLTDFAFLERGDPRAWAKNKQMLEVLDEANREMSDADEVSEDLSEWIEQNRLRYPLRSRQWLAQRDGWRALRDGELAPESIHAALGRI